MQKLWLLVFFILPSLSLAQNLNDFVLNRDVTISSGKIKVLDGYMYSSSDDAVKSDHYSVALQRGKDGTVEHLFEVRTNPRDANLQSISSVHTEGDRVKSWSMCGGVNLTNWANWWQQGHAVACRAVTKEYCEKVKSKINGKTIESLKASVNACSDIYKKLSDDLNEVENSLSADSKAEAEREFAFIKDRQKAMAKEKMGRTLSRIDLKELSGYGHPTTSKAAADAFLNSYDIGRALDDTFQMCNVLVPTTSSVESPAKTADKTN